MKALLVIGSIIAALAVAGAARAGGENGAIVLDSSGCTPSPFALVCHDWESVTNITTTPSGNTSYMTNGVIAVTLTNPFTGCSISQSQPVHLHWLQKDGEVQSRSERRTSTNEIRCGAFAQTCITTLEFHYANGDVQFNRPEVVCTTP